MEDINHNEGHNFEDNFEAQEFFLNFQLPSQDVHEVDLRGLENLFIRDLKQKLFRNGVGIPPSRMKILFKNRALEDREIIGDVGFQNHDLVYLILRVTKNDSSPVYVKYEDFVMSTSPKHLSINVPIDVTVTILLQADQLGRAVYTPALVDPKILPTLHSGNMLENFGNNMKQAMRRGYRKWADMSVHHRIVLLRVDENLEHHFLELRYDVEERNEGYDGGDDCSWQRYTQHPPVDCRVNIPRFSDVMPHAVKIHPIEPLLLNTNYAVLLMNNVPTVPKETTAASVMDFMLDGTTNDYLILFRTEQQRQSDSPSSNNVSGSRAQRKGVRKHSAVL